MAKRFEYELVVVVDGICGIYDSNGPARGWGELERLGLQGWEAYGLTVDPSDGETSVWLKREVSSG